MAALAATAVLGLLASCGGSRAGGAGTTTAGATVSVAERIALNLVVQRVTLHPGDVLWVMGARPCGADAACTAVLVPLQSNDGSVLRLVEAHGEHDGQPAEQFTAVAVGHVTLTAPQGCGSLCGGGSGQVAAFLATVAVEVTTGG